MDFEYFLVLSVKLTFLYLISAKCSTSSTDVPVENGRIIGGKSATVGQFPFLALLRMIGPDFTNEACGGALISRKHVLTAGHCSRFSSIDVILGTLDSMYYSKGYITMKVKKENIHTHPLFDKYTYLNDIAVLELPYPVNFTANIKPVSLPKKSQSPTSTFLGKQGVITGWGLTENDTSNLQEVLRFTNVTIMTHLKCINYYQLFDVGDGQICSSFNGKGTCNGDSGGPLVLYEKANPVLIGIISFGTTNCLKKAPSVYTNVAYYLDFIHNITKIPIS